MFRLLYCGKPQWTSCSGGFTPHFFQVMQKCGCSWQWVGLPHDMFVQYLNNPSLPRNNGNVIHHLTTFFVDPSIPSLPFSGDPTKMAWFDPSIWGLSENRVSQYVLMSQQSYLLVCKWICIYIYIYLFIYLGGIHNFQTRPFGVNMFWQSRLGRNRGDQLTGRIKTPTVASTNLRQPFGESEIPNLSLSK